MLQLYVLLPMGCTVAELVLMFMEGLEWCASLCSSYNFFVSSRRRHTRFDYDWSSDVCSSDLDTGSTYTWVPRVVLQRLGVTAEEQWPFELADGREVRYPVAWAEVRIGARVQPTIVVFGEDRKSVV